MDRRRFLVKLMGDTVNAVSECKEELDSIKEDIGETVDGLMDSEEPEPEFFDSYEMSYSLTLAYPREMFEQMAKKEGIEYTDRETIDIAKELHERGVI